MTTAEIREKIAAAEREYARLLEEDRVVNDRRVTIRWRMGELLSWNGCGEIPDLRRALSSAIAKETWTAGRRVRHRCSWHGKDEYPYIVAFLRLTQKCIIGQDEQGYERRVPQAHVHPDDLALILAGRHEELPLVAEVVP